MNAYVVTCLSNVAAAHATVEQVRRPDWGAEPRVVVQPPHWPTGRAAGSDVL